MKRLLFAGFLLLAGFAPALAYDPGAFNTAGAGAPTGVCPTNGQQYVDTQTTNVWNCVAGTWTQATRSLGQSMQVGSGVGVNLYSGAGGTFVKSASGCSTTASSTAVTCTGFFYVTPQNAEVTDTGSCIPAGTTISVNQNATSASTAVLSQNASGTCASDTFTIYYNAVSGLKPIQNKTGQQITDPVVCFGGGDGNAGYTNAEFAAQNELIQAALMTSPFGQATAVSLVFPAGMTGTIIPGDIQSGCGYAAGMEVAPGATLWVAITATTPTNPSTQLLKVNRAPNGNAGSSWTLLGGTALPPTPQSFSPALVVTNTTQTNNGSNQLNVAYVPPYLSASPTSFYASSTNATYAALFPAGTKVTSAAAGGTFVTTTNNVTGALTANSVALQFTLFQPTVFPSGGVTAGQTTVSVASCPTGVTAGFFVQNAGLPNFTQVVSCSGTTLTVSAAAIASIATTSPLQFSSYLNAPGVEFNPFLVKGTLQQRILSFLMAGDSEQQGVTAAYVTTTSNAVFNPASCVSNTATISVTSTNSGGLNLATGSPPVALYLSGQSPFTTTPFAPGTYLAGFSSSANTVTIAPCPLYTVPSGTAMGWGTTSDSPYDDLGWFEGGAQGYPVTSLARSGDYFGLWVNNRSMRTKIAGLSGYTDFISFMGVNDILNLGPTGVAALPAMESTYTTIWTAMANRGMRVSQGTIVPHTTGTYYSEPSFSTITVTAGGSGYTPSTPVTVTVAGGTLAPSPYALATQLLCQVNGSGVVTSCVVAATGGAGSDPAIGYYTAAPTVTGNVPTGGAGSGLTVTLGTYNTWQSIYDQTSIAHFEPTVTTMTSSSTTTASVSVNSLTNSVTPATAGTIAVGMYISTLSGAPLNTVITAVSGTGPYTLTLNNAVTFNASQSIQVVSLRTAFNDWIRTLPSPLTHYIEWGGLLETTQDGGFWCGGCTTDGLHTQTAVGQMIMAPSIKTLLASGAFTLP